MQRTPVDSSNLSSVGYGNSTLEIEFHSGKVYR
ncbi:MAG: KTSC domain-containing protein, partial [Clostridium sporogenes]|nr:KTSC domain-containing protein [Clostridium sporogenes]